MSRLKGLIQRGLEATADLWPPIRTAFGYNEAAMALAYFLDGQEPTQPAMRRGRAVRYTEEKIFYDDGVHL